MNTWVDVNGARIEKEFLDESICEANGYAWTEIGCAALNEHVHCMICQVAIDSRSRTESHCYKADAGFACTYCYEHFLRRRD